MHVDLGTPTPRGRWPAVPTSRWSRNRLGHDSIATTEKYLHTLPDADETALDALAKIRQRRPSH